MHAAHIARIARSWHVGQPDISTFFPHHSQIAMRTPVTPALPLQPNYDFRADQIDFACQYCVAFFSKINDKPSGEVLRTAGMCALLWQLFGGPYSLLPGNV